MVTQTHSTTHVLNSEDFFDGYPHLNNGRYPKYFDDARMEFTKSLGLDAARLVPKCLGFLVRYAEYDYINQVTQKEVEIKTRMVGRKGARFVIEQEMLYGGKLMATSKAEYFFFDLITRKPIRPPFEIL